jgi:SecD/SecF fusion protein
MKNKNTVIFLLIVFALICGYNLYWTFVQFNIEADRSELLDAVALLDEDKSEWSASDSATYREYQEFMADEDIQSQYQRAVDQSFTLGLDLQGGMFVTLEVGMDQLVKALASNPNDSTLNRALDCANRRQQTEAESFVSLFVECFNDINPNRSLGATFASVDLEIDVSTSDEEVQQILEEKAQSAFDRTFNIIRTRIDQFGVVSPNLQKQPGTGRILLELPGVKEPERVRQLLRSTAELEFYVCHSWNRSYSVLGEINTKLARMRGLIDTTATDTAMSDSAMVAAGDSLAEDDDAFSTLSDSDTAGEEPSDQLASESLASDDSVAFEDLSPEEQDQRRAQFRRENPLFAILNPANYEALYQQNSRTPRVGFALASDTAEINEIFRMEEIAPLIPPDMQFVWTYKSVSEESDFYELIAIRVNADGEPDLAGEDVSDARQDFDPNNGEPLVSMKMTPEGTKKWAQLTTAQARDNGHIAILLDGLVYSYPVVNEPITTGSSQISGDFEIEEAKDLANVLEAGQLDAPVRIEGEETVGPTLGVENIRSGMFSFIAAFVITLIFMGVYYARAGLIANVALIANLIFILGCSAAFAIVLTLPGIAAVVLTVGMAVDANVLIFERIREELKRDKTLKASIRSGFANAFSSVMDANITTFLTGVVLYSFGIGPIRGFAVALMIGIVTSLISALIITRLILDYYADKGGESINFGFSWTTGLFDTLKLNMVDRRKTFYLVSGAIVAVSLVSMVAIGFKTGVDLEGGRQFIVEFKQNDEPAPLTNDQVESIRENLYTAFDNNQPVIKTLSSSHQLMITTSYLVNNRKATDSVSQAMMRGLGETLGTGVEKTIIRTSDVGPTVASDIRDAAILSVVFSLLIIFFYILVRFRYWQYSLGAIAAVFHDVLIVLGIFSLLSLIDLPFSIEIDQALIAALLTIIGYSINDTVVVFDRIRENLAEMKSATLQEVYNASIDQTISRTLITSLTTFITALILFTFGGDVIRGFVFAIMIGILVGTYSSIFVASPISLDLISRQKVAEPEPVKKGKKS